MSAIRTENILDSNGKLVSVRVHVYGDNSQDYFADVPVDQAVGVSHASIISSVMSQLSNTVASKSAIPGLAISPSQVLAIAQQSGSTKK